MPAVPAFISGNLWTVSASKSLKAQWKVPYD